MAYIDKDEDVVYLPFYEADEPRSNENIYKLGNPYKTKIIIFIKQLFFVIVKAVK